MKKHKDKKSLTGFTLIELSLVISIIAILTAIIVPSFRNAEKQLALRRSAHKLGQDIRKVQEMAISSKTFNGLVPPGGYGAYFPRSQNYFILFADCNNNSQYDAAGNPCNGAAEIIETLSFEKNVYIKNVFGFLSHGEDCGGLLYNGQAIFIPPDPQVLLFNGDAACSTLGVVLCLAPDCAQTKTVTINKGGLIDIK